MHVGGCQAVFLPNYAREVESVTTGNQMTRIKDKSNGTGQQEVSEILSQQQSREAEVAVFLHHRVYIEQGHVPPCFCAT